MRRKPRAGHADFFVSLGESAAPHLWQPEQQVWFDRLEREHDNLRTALQFWLTRGHPGAALRLAASLSPFWEARGHLEEGLQWLGRALAAAQDADPAARGWAMFHASRLARHRGDTANEFTLLQGSLGLFRAGADPRGEIFALSHLGNAAGRRGELPAAREWEAQSVARARELGDPWYLAMALNNHAGGQLRSGNIDSQTEQLLAESLRLRRSLDEKRGIGITLANMAELHLLRGELDAAAATVEEMLSLASTLTHTELTCTALNTQGFLHLARGNPAQAAETFHASLQLSYPQGFQLDAADAVLGLAEAAAQQGDPSRALRLEMVASQVINTPEQQPGSFLQSAINRIEDHISEQLDAPAREAIRKAAQTITIDQILAEATAVEN